MGGYAYFESTIELRRLRFEFEKKQSKLSQNLHIMEECAVIMPISIGLDKNSPLKAKIDELVRFAVEAGLVNKWFKDSIKNFESSVEEAPPEAVLDLKKFFGALFILFVGCILSILAFIAEILYWNFHIKRSPHYDKYYRRIIVDCQLETLKIESRRRKGEFLKDRQINLISQ